MRNREYRLVGDAPDLHESSRGLEAKHSKQVAIASMKPALGDSWIQSRWNKDALRFVTLLWFLVSMSMRCTMYVLREIFLEKQNFNPESHYLWLAATKQPFVERNVGSTSTRNGGLLSQPIIQFLCVNQWTTNGLHWTNRSLHEWSKRELQWLRGHICL